MKIIFSILLFVFFFDVDCLAQRTYVGSTPAHQLVRNFLSISATDSIDFIRWQLVLHSDNFELECRYGLARGGTPGFVAEKTVTRAGSVKKTGAYFFSLQHDNRQLSIVEVNASLLHLADAENRFLVGNGGYSYALNNREGVKTDQLNIPSAKGHLPAPLIFEGRTPCQELSRLLGLNKSAACNKMKWYFIFYTDSVTGRPSYFLEGGMGYRKETMDRGRWRIHNRNGKIIYQVTPDNSTRSLYLLKGDENILFFIDPEGRLLVGNEDFSYTLNRRKEEYPPVIRK